MRKIIFLVLSIFTISSIGYSEMKNFDGIVFDDEIFGKTKECKMIGEGFILSSIYVIDTKLMNQGNSTNLKISMEKLKKEMNTEYFDDFTSYYSKNCKKIEEGKIRNTQSNYYNYVKIYTFYAFMNGFGLMKK
jgi:hypothetical protein